jgi:hypothetical protein
MNPSLDCKRGDQRSVKDHLIFNLIHLFVSLRLIDFDETFAGFYLLKEESFTVGEAKHLTNVE